MTESTTRPTFGSAVVYQDARSAIEWLEKAFGFETSMVVAGDDGKIAHSEMRFGNGYIMVADEWRQEVKSPKSLGGTNTQTIHVQLEAGIDAHCERARAAGARITQEPEDQFYGDRTYHAIDPEGHLWTFGQTVRQMSTQEMEQSGGMSIRTSL